MDPIHHDESTESLGDAAEQFRSQVEDVRSIDDITHEQAQALAEEAVASGEELPEMPGGAQMQVPMMTIPLNGAQLQIGKDDEGNRSLIVGPVAMTFVLPLPKEVAKAVGRELQGGIEIATKMPPIPPMSRR